MIKSLLLALVLLSSPSWAADSIIGTGGSNQLVDNNGVRWNTHLAYTTNGNGDVYTLGGLVAGDNYFGTGGNNQLIDNAGRRWNLDVMYTTDGAGNVIPITGGGGGGGITSLNTLTGATQTFATGTAGSDFGISSSGTTHTFNLPTASAIKRGLLQSSDFSTFNAKVGAARAINTTAPLSGGGDLSADRTLSCAVASDSQAGCLSAADHTAFNAKQATVLPGHDLWVDRNGSDSANCSIAAPCQTVGHALTLVTSPSSTNNWTIHLLSGRHDQETNDLLLPIYTWIVGNGGPDVGSYLRLPSGKCIKLDPTTWGASNGRGGIQSVYLGGSTCINLDFVGVGGSFGSNFMLDDVFGTGNLTQTGRGVNGGDFLYIQNSFIFGNTSLTGSQAQIVNSTWGGSFTAVPSSTVPTDITVIGGSFGGAVALNQSGTQHLNYATSGANYLSTFTTTGTVGLTADLNLPIGYTLSGGTSRTNTADAKSVPYTPATAGNWASAPAEVASALDAVALASKATSAATASMICKRDGSGAAFFSGVGLGVSSLSHGSDFLQTADGAANGFGFKSSGNVEQWVFDAESNNQFYLKDQTRGWGVIGANSQGRVNIGPAGFGHPDAELLVRNQVGSNILTAGIQKQSGQTQPIIGAVDTDESVKTYIDADFSFVLGTTASQPTCASGIRGKFWIVRGGSGVADSLQVCIKNAADAYVWQTVF